jgi:hypothetical protein
MPSTCPELAVATADVACPRQALAPACGVAFVLLATVLFAFFFAASAPSPLFVVFQHAWGFSSSMLTVAFAIYAIALLHLAAGGRLAVGPHRAASGGAGRAGAAGGGDGALPAGARHRRADRRARGAGRGHGHRERRA